MGLMTITSWKNRESNFCISNLYQIFMDNPIGFPLRKTHSEISPPKMKTLRNRVCVCVRAPFVVNCGRFVNNRAPPQKNPFPALARPCLDETLPAFDGPLQWLSVTFTLGGKEDTVWPVGAKTLTRRRPDRFLLSHRIWCSSCRRCNWTCRLSCGQVSGVSGS